MSFLKDLGSAVKGGITGGIGSLISSGIGSLFGSKGPSQEDLMRWQEQQLGRQLNFQREEAEKNREFQSKEAATARQWNSIASQLQRADAAGVNPFALVSSGQYGSASGAVAPSGSMPSGSGSIPQPAPNTRLQEMEGFSMVASALSSIAEAKKSGVETSQLEQSFQERLRKLSSDADGQELLNAYQRILNKYAGRRQSAEINEIWGRIDLMTSQEQLNYRMFDKVQKEIGYLAEKIGLTNLERRQLYEYLNKYFDRRQEAELRNIHANSVKALQEAATQGAVRENLHEQAGYYKTSAGLAGVNKKIADLNYFIQSQTSGDELLARASELKEQAKRAGIITSQMEVALDQAIKNKDWTHVRNLCRSLYEVSASYAMFRSGVPAPDFTDETVTTYEDNAGNRSATKTRRSRRSQ